MTETRDQFQIFQDWLDTCTEIYPIVFRRLGLNPDSVETLLDLGSGYGASLLSAGRYFVHAQLYACSVGETPTQEVRSELEGRLHFTEAKIRDYLAGMQRTVKLVIISSVPAHELVGEEDYSMLSNGVEEQGIIMEFGDTGLDGNLMRKYFEEIKVENSPLLLKAWRKKSTNEEIHPTLDNHQNEGE